MDRLRNFKSGRRTENKSVDKRDKERERENPGAKMDEPWNNSKRFNQRTQMGEELDKYRRRPYIDRHRNLKRKMGRERRSEKFPREKKRPKKPRRKNPGAAQ